MAGKRFVSEINITYSTLEDKVNYDIRLIEEIFEQLKREPIEGLKYAAYKMGENVFIHIAQFKNSEANKRFTGLDAFKKFTDTMPDRLLQNVLINDIEEIGSYGGL